MPNIPEDRTYTKDHEWAQEVPGGRWRVGLTDYAQRQLGDVVYVELPEQGAKLDASEPLGTVESVKAVSEIYMPLAGTVAAVNDTLADGPEQLNDDSYGDGWLIEIAPSGTVDTEDLLSAADYAEYVREESEE
ncbi:glycine cleavage system protein GcvH [Yinghuangia sp. YIM S09857]|uniref:glycine cleavage system protein GcvH n=1 Tax=Yinghuangia sp. YIM S09857 TaxID=3436929 RepID=UPI003F53A003